MSQVIYPPDGTPHRSGDVGRMAAQAPGTFGRRRDVDAIGGADMTLACAASLPLDSDGAMARCRPLFDQLDRMAAIGRCVERGGNVQRLSTDRTVANHPDCEGNDVAQQAAGDA
jgi:hypothetical protein